MCLDALCSAREWIETGSPKSSGGHRIERFFDGAGPDKVLKSIIEVSECAIKIGKETNASPETMKAFAGTRAACKTARDVNGIFSIFTGVMRSIVSNGIQAGRIVKGIFEKKEVVDFGHTHNDKKHNERAEGKKEQLLALGVKLNSMFGALGFTIVFGPLRTAGNINKYVVPSKTCAQMAELAPDFMLAVHAAGLLSAGCDFVYQQMAFQREVDAGRGNVAEKEYLKKISSAALNIILKFAELLCSVVKKLESSIAAMPIWFHLSLSGIIVFCSLYSVWQKTA